MAPTKSIACLLTGLMILTGLAAFVTSSAQAQLASVSPEPISGARMPTLSPDGRMIAFVYRGDIWTASVQGGRATLLTHHLATDAYPVFSPDGYWIAFASTRNGRRDIYAIPAEGGPAKQLTWHGHNDIPTGWSPDGKYLLHSSKRDSPHYTLYALDVNTLRSRVLAEDYTHLHHANYSPDGKYVVYGRYGFHWTRPRYVGSAARQTWLLNVETGARRALSTNEFQNLWARFLPDSKRILTITTTESTPSVGSLDSDIEPIIDNPRRTPNLHVMDLEGNLTQLTDFIGGAVRWPSVSPRSGDIAFEYEGQLWSLKKGATDPQPIPLLIARDEKQSTLKEMKARSGVTEAELSPDGKTFAFGLGGDIWVVGTERPKGVAGRNADLAKRLTDWVGDDSDFSWSPDAKKLYFSSDREFTTRLYEIDVETRKSTALWHRQEDITRIRISPDGKELGFWVSGKEGGLYLLNIKTKEARQLLKLPGPHWKGIGGSGFAWSPDLQWIAYSARSESGAWNIFVISTNGGTAHNVTKLYARHSYPTWSPDGHYLFFQSDREGNGLYALPLQKEPIRRSDTDIKFQKKKTNVVVKIDFDDIDQRIRKLTSRSPNADLAVTPDGQILFLSERDIWSVSFDGKQIKRLTSDGSKVALRVIPGAKKLSYMKGGDMYTASLQGKSAKKITFIAEWERDIRAEFQAAFVQFWNGYNRGFYDPNFHGRDWATIRSRYEPLLDAVETEIEFATLLQMMVGELETSHSEVVPRGGRATTPITPHLGFTFDYSYHGPGIRVKTVPDGTPGSYPETKLNPGEIILQVNGEDVSLDEQFYRFINNKQNRVFEFLVHTNIDQTAARTVKYEILTDSHWKALIYRNRTSRLRRYVEEKSGGRLGYLHLAAMGASNQARFEREAYEYMAGREAMIIDVRFNRGGNITDTLLDWIERKPHGYVRPRDNPPKPAPQRAWEKPCVVLMNEHSYSNAEMFANAMRARGLARFIVGMPTPGYTIWTTDMRLVNGSKARMPQSGVFRLDGSNMENNGEQPDVHIPLSTDDWLSERDPQLDKAIELLTEPEPEPTATVQTE